MSRARLWLALLGLGLSAAAVVLLLRAIDAGDAARRLAEVRVPWFLAACALTVGGYVVRAVRWGELLSPRRRPPLGRLFSATMIGFLAINTLPARLGELVRAYALSRMERMPVATVLGSVAVERVFDLAALGAFWSLSLLVAPLPDWFRLSGLVTLGLALAVTVGLLLFHRMHGWTHLSAEGAILSRLPAGPRRMIAAAIPAFAQGVGAIAVPSVVARSALWTVLMWLGNAAVFSLVAQSLGMQLPIWHPLLLAFLVCVGILIPSSPGFVGVLEGACVLGLGLLGVPGPEALAYGILYHATQLLPLILLGGWYAIREHVGAEILHEPAGLATGAGEKDGDSDALTR